VKISKRYRAIALACLVAILIAGLAIKVSAQTDSFKANLLCMNIGGGPCLQASGVGAPGNAPAQDTWSFGTDGHIYYWNGTSWATKV
jgi:hypothetical protein